MRCKKSKLTCLGYKDETELVFRHHYRQIVEHSPPEEPLRHSNPQTKSSITSPSSPEQHVSDNSDYELHALAAFLEDYCIVSKNRMLSRGYLEDLRPLLASAEPSSNIQKAAKIVALASLGNKSGEERLTHQASLLYSDLLHSFQMTVSNSDTSNAAESLTTAVLLGLYEVCFTGNRICLI